MIYTIQFESLVQNTEPIVNKHFLPPIVEKSYLHLQYCGRNKYSSPLNLLITKIQKKSLQKIYFSKNVQTVFANLQVHTELIVINNVAFHKFISSYPKLIDRISHINELNCEFWESDVDANTKIVNVEAQPSALLLSSSSNRATSQSVTSRTLIRAIQKKISHNNQYYKIWQHIMEFHLAAMSSILMNYFIFMGPQNVRIFFMTFKYTMDVAYLSMFYFGFRTTFTNSETGIVESDTKLIAMRYLKSLFWLDLLSVLPLDLTALFFGFSYRQQRYMSANRLLRYFYVILFYAKNKYKLKGIAFVRWSYLIYNIMFVIQCLTSLW